MRTYIVIFIIVFALLHWSTVGDKYVVIRQFETWGQQMWELQSLESDLIVAWPTDRTFSVGDTLSPGYWELDITHIKE